jgi:hypothetical protein
MLYIAVMQERYENYDRFCKTYRTKWILEKLLEKILAAFNYFRILS